MPYVGWKRSQVDVRDIWHHPMSRRSRFMKEGKWFRRQPAMVGRNGEKV
jgi:hypothetical protein